MKKQHNNNMLITLWLLLGTGVLCAQPVLVKDIKPGTAGSIVNNTPEIRMLGDKAYFWADNGTNGVELWVSDGNEAGTRMVKDITPGTGSSGPGKMTTVFKNQLFFDATTPSTGTELWSTDGTDPGTKILLDACSGTCSGADFGRFPPEIAELNGNLILGLGIGGSSTKLCITDGSSANTKLLNNVTLPGNMFRFKNRVFFTVNSFDNILRVTDGTAAGTLPFKNYGSRPEQMISNDSLFFFWVKISSADLYRSNGTPAGTFLVRKGDDDAFILNTKQNRAIVNGKLLFESVVSGSGASLWVSDGTVSGTVLLKEIMPGFSSDALYFLGKLGEKLIFSAYSNLVGNEELWISDATADGTKLLKEITPGATGSTPRNGIKVFDKMLFTAVNANSQLELWRTDGTEVGTIMLTNLATSAGIKEVESLVWSGNNLFFMATTNAAGKELWKLDVTPPVASVIMPRDTVCVDAPLVVTASPSPGSNLAYMWDFGIGASPQTAQGLGPHNVKYSNNGKSTIRLIVSNGIVADTTFEDLSIINKPVPNFSFVKNAFTFTFTNTTSGDGTYLWDFGDGGSSTDKNPVHSYGTAGTYTVKLSATNECGTATISKPVMPTVGTSEVLEEARLSIAPNPSDGVFSISGRTSKGGESWLRITDLHGRILRHEALFLPSGDFSLRMDAKDLQPKLYLLTLQTPSGLLTTRFSIMQ